MMRDALIILLIVDTFSDVACLKIRKCARHTHQDTRFMAPDTGKLGTDQAYRLRWISWLL